ncbi:MAG: transglycosylase domain-containing protein [Christensenellales bacterium]|jgi:membrane peptidoglycan carboxypeptidase
MKKLIKFTSLILIIIAVSVLIYGVSYYLVITKDLSLSESNLGFGDNTIDIFNLNDEPVNKSEYADTYVTIDNISDDLKNAFISIEDKRFYKHKGVDVIRVLGALKNNIKARRVVEGASTISQQLIKNTHLNSERSISRKIQEAKLAINLEKNYSKDEILEMYLNNIYFGSGIYGVENASQRFFDKSSGSLTLSECAMLAGIVKNPSKYSPVTNYNNSLKRRNLVLELMEEQDMIDSLACENAQNESIEIKFLPLNKSETRPYIKNSIRQAADLLNISRNELISGDYRIYTYLDADIQHILADRVFNCEYYKSNINGNFPDGMGIIADNKTGGIIAYASTTPYQVFDIRRQPGSAIKPLAVYAPALEYNVITPATQILDEFTSFDNYKPHNYNNAYHGWVSARTALMKSLNVPSVKIMTYLGADRALDFIEKIGFNTNGEDSSLSLALGGTRNGATLCEMTSAYMALANSGNFNNISFIRKITDKAGNVLYEHNSNSSKVLSDENAYLITDMLMDTAKLGTASKLKSLDFQVASKTGTVAYSDSNFNTDAWSVSYTTAHTLCLWQGNISNNRDGMLDKGITGGSYPTMMTRDILREVYRYNKPVNFTVPEGIIEVELDTVALENEHLLMLAGEMTPDEYRVKEKFSCSNCPKEVSMYFSKPAVEGLSIEINEQKPVITFNARAYISYTIERNTPFERSVIAEINSKDGQVNFIDGEAPSNSMISYTVYPKIIINGNEILGEAATTKTVFTLSLRLI